MILYSPVDMPGTLGMGLWRCGGSGEGDEEKEDVRGPAKPIASVRGPWVGLQVPGNWMRYMCDTCTWASHSRGHYTVQSRFLNGVSD